MRKIVAKTGSYQNAQGETKGRYTNIGIIMNNDNGEFILIDPAVSLSGVLVQQNIATGKNSDRVLCSIFDQDNQQQAPQQRQQPQQQPAQQPQQPQQQQQQQAPQQQAQGGGGAQGFDEDVPFAQYERNSII